MNEHSNAENNFFLVSAEQVSNSRGKRPPSKIMVNVLGENINVFLSQMNGVLENTPSTVSTFQFVEFEITAEVNAKGQIVIMGTGGELGLTSGIKFVFRKLPAPNKTEKTTKRKSKK
jgi:hypothetical protein